MLLAFQTSTQLLSLHLLTCTLVRPVSDMKSMTCPIIMKITALLENAIITIYTNMVQMPSITSLPAYSYPTTQLPPAWFNRILLTCNHLQELKKYFKSPSKASLKHGMPKLNDLLSYIPKTRHILPVLTK